MGLLTKEVPPPKGTRLCLQEVPAARCPWVHWPSEAAGVGVTPTEQEGSCRWWNAPCLGLVVADNCMRVSHRSCQLDSVSTTEDGGGVGDMRSTTECSSGSCHHDTLTLRSLLLGHPGLQIPQARPRPLLLAAALSSSTSAPAPSSGWLLGAPNPFPLSCRAASFSQTPPLPPQPPQRVQVLGRTRTFSFRTCSVF